tara:strand:+ start:1457 stop:1930 length:474 start_codon:yes stop_codon:yes gene_type:complete
MEKKKTCLENKIVEELKLWKSLSKKIVFTNGCFDLLHKGHLDLLHEASKFGDILLVGLNSDKSVKKLKGNSRPIEPQKVRKENLLKVKFISDVIIFEELTPLKLINTIEPDFLVKGGDYKPNNIVGAKEIVKWGGVVKIIKLTPGFSTTDSIKKSKL